MNMRELKKGDRFVVVGLVDLAVSLTTLGVPFFDPARPYLYQMLGNKRIIKFYFEETSEAIPSIPKLIKGWPDAETYCEPIEPLGICKRTIWERRWLLTEVSKHASNKLQSLASDLEVIEDVKVAAIAYALGFYKPDSPVIDDSGRAAFLVGKSTPLWLHSRCDSLAMMMDQIEEDVLFIEKPENEFHPVAVANAAFINASAWLDHLRNDKPYLQFTTASGKSFWVKEGSPRWSELVGLGYSPH